jgi:hypothetical protein
MNTNRVQTRLAAIPVPLSNPPTTFLKCVQQAVKGAKLALAQGENLLEVEFPPLPLEYLDDSSSSARDVSDANTRWAIEFAKSFTESYGQITILYPDDAELQDGIKYVDMQGGDKPFPNIFLSTARVDSLKNAKSFDQVLISIFGATIGGKVEPVAGTKMYIAIITSTQELPDLEKLHAFDPSIPIIFFNLRLDVLRGDLGLPLFPGRDLHYRFLTKVLPVYIMRSRSFATSIRRPPFIVNYSGLLYRTFPEPYQCILNVGDGKNKMVKAIDERPTFMGFRNFLTDALRLPGVPQDELQSPGNLVWWEKDLELEEFNQWRKDPGLPDAKETY